MTSWWLNARHSPRTKSPSFGGSPTDAPTECYRTSYHHRISAAARESRSVTISGRGPTWAAAVTAAGNEYLDHVAGPDPPMPRQANASVTQQLVNDVIAAGSVLRIHARAAGPRRDRLRPSRATGRAPTARCPTPSSEARSRSTKLVSSTGWDGAPCCRGADKGRRRRVAADYRAARESPRSGSSSVIRFARNGHAAPPEPEPAPRASCLAPSLALPNVSLTPRSLVDEGKGVVQRSYARDIPEAMPPAKPVLAVEPPRMESRPGPIRVTDNGPTGARRAPPGADPPYSSA